MTFKNKCYICNVVKVNGPTATGNNKYLTFKIMFTAKVQTPDGTIKCIPNCILYKGRIVVEAEKGVGEPTLKGGMFNGEGDVWEEYDSYEKAFKPYFNSVLLKKR